MILSLENNTKLKKKKHGNKGKKQQSLVMKQFWNLNLIGLACFLTWHKPAKQSIYQRR